MVLSSPHSGQCYPPAMLAQVRLAPELLRALDDGPVDELLARGCAAGATLIAATYPRAVVDLNRGESEQDPDTLDDPAAVAGLRATVKARAGLGVVPTRLLGEPIYADAAERRRAAAADRRRLPALPRAAGRARGRAPAALRRVPWCSTATRCRPCRPRRAASGRSTWRWATGSAAAATRA